MAKVKLNSLITEISGTMGDFYFRKGKNFAVKVRK